MTCFDMFRHVSTVALVRSLESFESRFEEEGRWLQEAQDAENVDMSTLFPQAEAEPNCVASEELRTYENPAHPIPSTPKKS